jgi:hypothetical protein
MESITDGWQILLQSADWRWTLLCLHFYTHLYIDVSDRNHSRFFCILSLYMSDKALEPK